ncbi:MAG: hypothetical protein WD708_00310 [Kiritimatiellia bacterium]
MNASRLPRHQQLRENLLRQWKLQRLKKGAKIAGQTELVASSGFSLATVLKTLKDLEADGIIERKVGVGSYILHPVWETGSYQVGFYYNRDVVGGSILNNPFYGNLLRHLESALLAEGHEFIYGSFSADTMIQESWKDLDALFLTGLTGGPQVSDFAVDAVVAELDAYNESPPTDTFHLDASPAFEKIVRQAKEISAKRILYVDSVYTDPQTEHRYQQFRTLLRRIVPGATHDRISCDTEHDLQAEKLMRQLEKNPPDIILGYIHPAWKKSIADGYGKKIRVYNFAAKGEDSESIEVDYAAWTHAIWKRTEQRIQNINTEPVCHHFPTT